jgi:hypothetical protein
MSSEDYTRDEEEAWVASERDKIVAYLVTQGVDHLGVGGWPAFHLCPHFASWAVQSKKWPGSIGWWAIGGDMPTDYMSGDGVRHPRKAMEHFSRQWAEVSDCMDRGETHPGTKIGNKEVWPELAPLLKIRSELLGEFAANDDLWAGHEEERAKLAARFESDRQQ